MCEPDEQILSDVHLLVTPQDTDSKTGFTLTRFKFRIPEKIFKADTKCFGQTRKDDCTRETLEAVNSLVWDKEEVEVDEDGDLVLRRSNILKPNSSEEVITIEHRMATAIQDVGLQVWMGSMLLCDFIVSHQYLFKDCHVLELGGGMGLCSLVAAFSGASTVFCTDTGDNILTACKNNVERNQYLFSPCDASHHRPQKQELNAIRVKELDWRKMEFPPKDKNCYHWTEEEMQDVKNVEILLVADLIYDDPLTDDLFSCILWLMELGKPKSLYVALEKRFNFSVNHLDVTCKAYQHFMQWVETLQMLYEYSCQQIKPDFPQLFEYHRTEQLELWKISKT